MPQGLDLYGYQEAITSHVETLYPNYDILEDTVVDDAINERDANGKMSPFIILRYGPLMPVRRGKSFAGARYDEYYSTVDVMAIASKGNVARKLNAAVVQDLIGWAPDGFAPMSLQDDGGMFAAFVVSSNEARPTRSIVSQRFRYNINTNSIGTITRP